MSAADSRSVDARIAGAGDNGLRCASHLAATGLRARVFGRHGVVGGADAARREAVTSRARDAHALGCACVLLRDCVGEAARSESAMILDPAVDRLHPLGTPHEH